MLVFSSSFKCCTHQLFYAEYELVAINLTVYKQLFQADEFEFSSTELIC